MWLDYSLKNLLARSLGSVRFCPGKPPKMMKNIFLLLQNLKSLKVKEEKKKYRPIKSQILLRKIAYISNPYMYPNQKCSKQE